MNQELDERIEAYLDGLLSGEQAAAFERELTRPEVAAAFAEALALRQLLAEAPPEQPPAGLIEQIELDLGVAPGVPATPRRAQPGREQRLPRARAALHGLGWSLRGPALALAHAAPGTTARDSAAAAGRGLRTVRLALGPLQRERDAAEPNEARASVRALRYAYSRLRRDEEEPVAERPWLWRRLFGRKA
jgi:anti-sigma factor RsiW